MEIKKNLSLILGISIPILMVLFVIGSIYLPSFFIKPNYNFLYTLEISYMDYPLSEGAYRYSVKNNELIREYIDASDKEKLYISGQELFFYDVAQNVSREISFEEAQKLSLNTNLESPDGFEIVYGSRGEGIFPFLFWSGYDYNSRYIKGHYLSKKLNIQSYTDRYYFFDFLGWIM